VAPAIGALGHAPDAASEMNKGNNVNARNETKPWSVYSPLCKVKYGIINN